MSDLKQAMCVLRKSSLVLRKHLNEIDQFVKDIEEAFGTIPISLKVHIPPDVRYPPDNLILSYRRMGNFNIFLEVDNEIKAWDSLEPEEKIRAFSGLPVLIEAYFKKVDHLTQHAGVVMEIISEIHLLLESMKKTP